MSIDHVIKFELGRLSQYLPKQQISLKDALAADKPQVIARDGSVHAFKREELEFLAKIVPESDQGRLKLPIFIMLNPKLGRGTAQIMGEVEVRTIASIMQKEYAGSKLLLYRPEIAIVRRKLPTTTQYFFKIG